MQPVYRSTDSGAPTLGNVNGSLVGVLDAVLVNGYGALAPLGWTIAYTGTNKRVYQQGAGSNGFQVRVDDSGNVYEAKVRGAEAFSDVDTIGSGGFPTVAQAANGVFWQKTNNVAGNREWLAWGDAKRFVMLADITGGAYNGMYFGDFVSFKAGDAFNCLLIGKPNTIANQNGDVFGSAVNSSFGTLAGHYIARAYTGVGSAVAAGKYCDGRTVTSSIGGGTVGSNLLPYPDPVSGGLHLSRIFISESYAASQYVPRGYLPGIWAPCHDRANMVSAGVTNGDTFNGTDGIVSRSFEFRFLHTNNGSASIVIETSDWPESA